MNHKRPISDSVLDFKSRIAKLRAKRLGRGGVMIQRGMFDIQEVWDKKRAEHPEKLERVCRWLESGK